MAHSNGRIYTETISGVRHGITLKDVSSVIGIAGNDVGTLCRVNTLNMWSKYRPMPIPIDYAYSKAAPLTDAERKAFGYGIDFGRYSLWGEYMTVPYQIIHDISQGIMVENDMMVTMRKFDNSHQYIYRLLDYIRVNDNGEIVDNTGYNHNAGPAIDEITVNGATYMMGLPLYNVGGRDLYIEDGSQYGEDLPDDTNFLKAMYDYEQAGIGDLTDHIEMLSVYDILSGVDSSHTLYNPIYGAAIRCVHLIAIPGETLYEGVAVAGLDYANAIYGMRDGVYYMTGAKPTVSDDYITPVKVSGSRVTKLDLSDSSQLKIYNKYGDIYDVSKISGRVWLVEYYSVSNHVDVAPIPGYAYTINITRVGSGDTSLDVEGYFEFGDFGYSASDGCYLYIYAKDNIDIHDYLISHYTVLQLTAGDVTCNLLTQASVIGPVDVGQGWYLYGILIQTPSQVPSQAILSGRKAGATVTATKTLSVVVE